MTALLIYRQWQRFKLEAYIMHDETQHMRKPSDSTDRGPDNHAILIVEDEKLVAWDIEQTLLDFGFTRISVTHSVSGAQSLSKSKEFSLAIVDLKLADGDGALLINEFHSGGTQVLVVTGYDRFEHEHAPVLYKPFSASALIQAVRTLLSSARSVTATRPLAMGD
jgi:DNA-binding response OmpR family regulator